MCCFTMLCYNNWTPSNTILKIIKQISELMNEKQMIYKTLLIDRIKYQYLIDDIDIESWLI